jgi:hypothetical protein
MKDPVLILSFEGKEKKIPLNKEKIFLGRDAECDLVLEGKDFSRKHVAIHYKHGLIYVENISTSGEIKIANKATEYAELRQDEEVVIGNYILKWAPHDGREEIIVPTQEPKQEDFNSFGDQNSLANQKINTQSSNHLLSDQSLSDVVPGSATNPSGDLMMNPDMEQALSQEKTVQVSNSSFGMFRIISGEIAGREIKLEHGKEWIVGRAKECHVSINNSKLSRHHFKINQIFTGFRIKDLDSSYGIKVNGVGVKDAPLKSLDVISAGPVEIQFIIADKNIGEIPELSPHVPALLNASTANASPQNLHLEKTNVPAVVNTQNINANFGFSHSNSDESSLNQKIEKSQAEAPRKPLPKERIDILIKKFKGLNKNEKIIFVSASLLILVILLSFFLSSKPQPKPQIAETPPVQNQASDEVDNAAESGDFSPEYMLKTPKEKAKIQELYVRAEEARARGEWQKAFDISTEIIKSVNNFKRTKDILSEAQSYLTDLQIATLTKTPDDPESANLNTQQKIDELLTSGETALNEKRWEDAQEIYTKALLLDPKNEAATRGQYAAQMKNAEGLNKKLPIEEAKAQESSASSSSEASTSPIDINAELLQANFEEINKSYQDSKQKIQEGSFREAYPVLKELKAKIEILIGEEESNRAISSTNTIAEDKRTLRSKIIESMDLVNEQYILEYKTQLDDAQQAKANQKLVEARAIYDSIIRKDPLFEEPRVEREKLYRKMIADGQATYREALISESLGNVSDALELYEKSKSFFEKVEKKEAQEYYIIVDKKMRVLKK